MAASSSLPVDARSPSRIVLQHKGRRSRRRCRGSRRSCHLRVGSTLVPWSISSIDALHAKPKPCSAQRRCVVRPQMLGAEARQRPASLGAASIQRRRPLPCACSSRSAWPMSAAEKQIGSRHRAYAYGTRALHSPPGHARIAPIASSEALLGTRTFASSAARVPARRALRRRADASSLGREGSAPASRCAWGRRTRSALRPGRCRAAARLSARTIRAASVRAPRDRMLCPRIARTAARRQSHPPGTRTRAPPPRSAINGRSRGSRSHVRADRASRRRPMVEDAPDSRVTITTPVLDRGKLIAPSSALRDPPRRYLDRGRCVRRSRSLASIDPPCDLLMPRIART